MQLLYEHASGMKSSQIVVVEHEQKHRPSCQYALPLTILVQCSATCIVINAEIEQISKETPHLIH